MRKIRSKSVSDLPTGMELINMRSHRSNHVSSTPPDALAVLARLLPCASNSVLPPTENTAIGGVFLQFGDSQHCLITPPTSGQCPQGRSKTSSSPLAVGPQARDSALPSVGPAGRQQWLVELLALDRQQARCLCWAVVAELSSLVTAQCSAPGTGPGYVEFCEIGYKNGLCFLQLRTLTAIPPMYSIIQMLSRYASELYSK